MFSDFQSSNIVCTLRESLGIKECSLWILCIISHLFLVGMLRAFMRIVEDIHLERYTWENLEYSSIKRMGQSNGDRHGDRN